MTLPEATTTGKIPRQSRPEKKMKGYYHPLTAAAACCHWPSMTAHPYPSLHYHCLPWKIYHKLSWPMARFFIREECTVSFPMLEVMQKYPLKQGKVAEFITQITHCHYCFRFSSPGHALVTSQRAFVSSLSLKACGRNETLTKFWDGDRNDTCVSPSPPSTQNLHCPCSRILIADEFVVPE